jgi:hypothetical protein
MFNFLFLRLLWRQREVNEHLVPLALLQSPIASVDVAYEKDCANSTDWSLRESLLLAVRYF